MVRIQYQLLKDNEPIALGSMVHCLDVFYWEIYHGYNHLAYNIVPFRQDEEVYRKAKAFDEIKGFIIRKLKEEEEQYLIQSEQDVGQYKAYNHIDDIIQEYKGSADDER